MRRDTSLRVTRYRRDIARFSAGHVTLDELRFGGGGIRATRRPRGWLSLGPPTRSHDAVVVLAVSCMMRCCISAHHARRRFARRLEADVSGEGISGIATPRKGPCVTARSAVFQRWDTGVLSFFRYLVSKLAPPQSRVTIRLFLQKPKTRFRRRRDFSTAWDSRRCFTPAPSFGQACTDVCKSPSRAHRCVVAFFFFLRFLPRPEAHVRPTPVFPALYAFPHTP